MHTPITKMDEGIIHRQDGIFIYATVYPLLDPRISMPESMWEVKFDTAIPEQGYYWHLVSHVKHSVLGDRTRDFKRQLVSTFIFTAIAFIGVSILVAFTRRKRWIAEDRIIDEASIFNENPAPVLRVDADGNVVKANIAAYEALRLEALMDTSADIFSKLDPQSIRDLEPADAYQFEQEIGDAFYFFTVKKNPSDGSYLFYGSNVTNRKEIQKEIIRLSTAVEQSATAILITDLSGIIGFANASCARSSGYSVNELIGKHTRIFKSGNQDREIYGELWRSISSGNAWHGELLNRRKDGTCHWEDVAITPIRDDEGRMTGYLAVKEDITARRETDDQLRRAKEQAEAASRLKSEFLANMSHEIRTPMNAILGFTDFLIDKEGDREKLKNLQIIKNSGRHLLALINDILDFSKIEADRIDIELQPFSLRGVLDHLENLLRDSVRRKKLFFRMTVADEVPQVVNGDEHRITQVLLNILGNAIKFTERGGVTVACNYLRGNIVIGISDTGIGIEPRNIEIIFSPFQQADSTTERTHGGTGLGLAISRRLVELMGGTIVAESEKGVGSRFEITIPMEVVTSGDREYRTLTDDDKSRDAPGELLQLMDMGAAADTTPGESYGEMMVQSWLSDQASDDMLRQVVLKGIRDLPVKLQKLKKAKLEQNSKEFARIIHDLKGYTGNLRMTEVFQVAEQLLTLTREPDYSFLDIGPSFEHLEYLVSTIPDRFFEEGIIPSTQTDVSLFAVLTAEDNETNQELFRILLKDIGLSSDFVGDGRAVLDKLNQTHYDLLLLDMQMPVMDGAETIKAIRMEPRFDELHVIAITAHAMEGDEARYRELGCNDYLSKPIDRDRFAECIGELISSKQRDRRRIDTLRLDEEQAALLDSLVRELKGNLSIFNPVSVKSIANRLGKFSSHAEIQKAAKKLSDAAEDFDDGCVGEVMTMIDRISQSDE